MDSTDLLARYDTQLRTRAEVADLAEVVRMGPLWVATNPLRQRGFVTYQHLDGLTGAALDALVAQVVRHFADDPRVQHFEWKTRAHDLPSELPQVLTRHGLAPEEPETVVVGSLADVVAADDGLPDGYRLERATSDEQLRAFERVAGQVFGDDEATSASMAAALVQRAHEQPDSFEMWAVLHADEVVCSGRIDFVEGTDFATIWGGACLPEHRGRGLYRALTAQRARRAQLRGKELVQSDCPEFSRPILQRAGLVAVTTTTPWRWRR